VNGHGADRSRRRDPVIAQRRLHPVLVAVLGAILVLVAGELVVRRWIVSPAATMPDPRYSTVYRPNASVVHSSEGWSSTRTNSMGLLDDELRVPRAPVRALLFGDSYTAALQVSRRDNYQSVAERKMPGLELVNVGGAGHGPLAYANWLDDHGARLAPDLVVVQVEAGDLVSLTQPAVLARLSGRQPEEKPAAVSPLKARWHELRLALNRSALVTAGFQRLQLLDIQRRTHPPTPFRRARPAAPAGDPYADPRLPAALDTLHRRLAAGSPRILYLYLPLMDYFGDRTVRADARAAAVWHDFAARNHVTLLDMFEPLRAEFERTGRPPQGFANSVLGTGHLNRAGHRVVGGELARAITEAMR
jgi:hypothetical protein